MVSICTIPESLHKDDLKSFITNAAMNKDEANKKELKMLTSDLFKYYEEHNE